MRCASFHLWVLLNAEVIEEMAQWQLESKPKAEMTAVDPRPIDRGDGATVQRWKTNTGVVHAQVVFPTGRVEWYLLVQA